MSETPEGVLLQHRCQTFGPYAGLTPPEQEALASLRQRQEERDEFYQALLREQASESERDIASLRTQLQQAEVEHGILEAEVEAQTVRAEQAEAQLQQAERERDAHHKRASDNYLVLEAKIKQLESQLQQAETALRFYADPENWEDGTLYHYALEPSYGPETIAERALHP